MEIFSVLLAICAGKSPVNSSLKGQWHGALMFCLICTRINGWVNNGEAGDLRRHRAHYDVTVMNAALLSIGPLARNTLPWNSNQNTQIFIQEISFEIVICTMSTFLSASILFSICIMHIKMPPSVTSCVFGCFMSDVTCNYVSADGGRDGLWWPALPGHWLPYTGCWQSLLVMYWLLCLGWCFYF